MKSKHSLSDIFLVLTFFICLGIFAIGILALPKQHVSQKENRPLASAPEMSLQSIISGRFFDELNAFYSDHVPLRSSLTSLHALNELVLRSGECNRVLYKNSSTLIPLSFSTNCDKISRIYEFSASRENVFLYVAPRPIDALDGTLAHSTGTNGADALLSGEVPQYFNELINSEQRLYYGTDHHWTTDGAYFAYRQICEQMGLTAFEEEYFDKITVSDDFYGTSFSQSALPSFLVAPDSIKLYRYDGDCEFTVTNRETSSATDGFYRFEYLDKTDKYAVFLGGNYAHLSIQKKDSKSRDKLLLIKDSYANSVIPFLAIHFDIEVIDPRYCDAKYLKEQIESTDADRILILMGLQTLIN